MSYAGRHRKHPDPSELPPVLRGVADLIEIISDDEKEN